MVSLNDQDGAKWANINGDVVGSNALYVHDLTEKIWNEYTGSVNISAGSGAAVIPCQKGGLLYIGVKGITSGSTFKYQVLDCSDSFPRTNQLVGNGNSVITWGIPWPVPGSFFLYFSNVQVNGYYNYKVDVV